MSKPDIAFVGYPPIECAFSFAKWLRKWRIPYIVDAKDQWPEIFTEHLPQHLKFLASLILFPYFFMGRWTFRNASSYCSITDDFLSWMHKFAATQPSADDLVVNLTAPRPSFSIKEKKHLIEWWDEQGVKLSEKKRMCFVGSFSLIYDFEPLEELGNWIKSKQPEFEIVICGNGSQVDRIRDIASGCDQIKLIGWIDAKKIDLLMENSLCAWAPYRNTPDFMSSIPNKAVDALAYNIPIVSPLRGNLSNLINKFNCGLNYSETYELIQGLERLMSNEKLILEMKKKFEKGVR